MTVTGYEKAALCFPNFDNHIEQRVVDRAQKEADNTGKPCEIKHGGYTLMTVEPEV